MASQISETRQLQQSLAQLGLQVQQLQEQMDARDQQDELAGNRANLSKLSMVLAYIEQGSLDSAWQILNEVINEGDEEQTQEARLLLAKIA